MKPIKQSKRECKNIWHFECDCEAALTTKHFSCEHSGGCQPPQQPESKRWGLNVKKMFSDFYRDAFQSGLLEDNIEQYSEVLTRFLSEQRIAEREPKTMNVYFDEKGEIHTISEFKRQVIKELIKKIKKNWNIKIEEAKKALDDEYGESHQYIPNYEGILDDVLSLIKEGGEE